MREHSGELTTSLARITGNQGDQLAIQPGLAHQQAVRDRNADPSILDDVHRQAGAAGGQVARNIDGQIIVNTGQRGFHRRRIRVTLGWKSLSAKRFILLHRDHDPSRRMRCLLCGSCED